jgi:23S rRNA (pseudouridine1915-N3)-methyltransferase
LRTTLLAVGKVRPPYAEADAHYRKLLTRYQPLDVIEVKSDRDLERRMPGGDAHVAALDREGRAFDSLAFAEWLRGRRLAARDLWFVIGGAEGIPGPLAAQADERISFGPQTMAHQLARVVLLEQLFRASKIIAGETYHH